MRQKQQVLKIKGSKASSTFVKLAPKVEQSALFTGSPNLQAKRKNIRGRKLSNTSAKSNKSNHPAFASPTSTKTSARRSGKHSSSEVENSKSDIKVARKYRPGTKALREIRKYQKGTELLLQRAPFQRLVRELTSDLSDETTRFTADALQCLQTASEAFIIQVFEDSVLAMIHAKRVTLMVRDIQFIRRLRGI